MQEKVLQWGAEAGEALIEAIQAAITLLKIKKAKILKKMEPQKEDVVQLRQKISEDKSKVDEAKKSLLNCRRRRNG